MASTKWILDPSHSEVQFKVKHLMITTVTGSFKNYTVEAETEGDDFTTGAVAFTADVNSIDTNNEQRDGHLKSPDFFDAASHPQIKFNSTRLSRSGDDYKLEGNLEIRGNVKPVSLDVEFGGIVVDPYGQTKAGFTVTGKISRKEFGLTWSAATEAGQIVVSDDVKINCEIQLVKQP